MPFPSFWERAFCQPQYPDSQETYSILWLCLLQCSRHINFAPTIKACRLANIKETNNSRETQTLRPNSTFGALLRWFRPNICQCRGGLPRLCMDNMAEGEKVRRSRFTVHAPPNSSSSCSPDGRSLCHEGQTLRRTRKNAAALQVVPFLKFHQGKREDFQDLFNATRN